MPNRDEDRDQNDLSNHSESIIDRISQLDADEVKQLRASLMQELYYQRPVKFTSRFLPPIPVQLEKISINDESLRVMSELPSYRFSALTTVLGLIGGVIFMIHLVPALILSPFLVVLRLLGKVLPVPSGVFAGIMEMLPSTIGTVLLIISIIAPVVVIVKRKAIDMFFLKAALREELWFRSGAEGWILVQKITSCVVFGWIHIYHLIYPISSLIAVGFAGGVFTRAYTREYRRSGDVMRATLASTKFHARCNVYVLRFIVSVLFSMGLISLFS